MLVIKETRFKTPMRYYFVSTNWQKLKYPPTTAGKDRAARNRVHCWMECKTVRPLWKMILCVVPNLKIRYDPPVLIPDIYPRAALSNRNRSHIRNLKFLVATLHKSKPMKLIVIIS